MPFRFAGRFPDRRMRRMRRDDFSRRPCPPAVAARCMWRETSDGIDVEPPGRKQAMAAEAGLVARLRANDQAAFRDLVRARHGRLLRLAGALRVAEGQTVIEEVLTSTPPLT